ncbi:peptidoglycan-binding protein, partial [bacterium]|nr:peptidoglycan-binding protein [bacterium]
MAPVLRTASDTLLKRRPLQLNLLQPEEKYPVEAGREFVISGFTQERNHIRFSLLDQTLNGFDIWYAFGKHVEVLEMDWA